jgi:4a-hydroxytetrahydrobiopterin dehydratase
VSDLTNLSCILPRKSGPALTEDEIQKYMQQLSNWKIVEEQGIKQLERVYKFKNFIEALAFTNKVGELAEEQDHHPAIKTEWGKVTLTWWTHTVKGLHRNDFIMAAKSDAAYTH